MTFGQAVRALHDGRCTFGEFCFSTSKRWRRYAMYIAKRWRLPDWVELEELEQELLLGAWRAVFDFNPHYGTSLERYVVWNAIDKAKKRAHAMRGAAMGGSPDRAVSRFELTFARWGEHAEELAEERLSVAPPQFDEVVHNERVEQVLMHCMTERERLVVRMLGRTRSIEAAAARLYEDEQLRRACCYENELEAARGTARAAVDVARRLRMTEAR